jgi:hypothetical protein
MVAKRPARVIPLSEFEQNRQKYAVEDLLPYQGMWVGFSPDGATILGGDPDLVALHRRLAAAGHDISQVPIEFIDFEDISLGGVAVR